jgi:Protein of unknown function (DUF4231)
MWGWFKGRPARRKPAKNRLDELSAFLVKPGGNQRDSDEAKKAIAYCESCIIEYEGWFKWNEGRWLRWQRVVIIGGVVATLAGVVSLPPSWTAQFGDLAWLGWLRGVPAAIVTIAAGFLSSFTYREDAVRHELTQNALWSELIKFQGKADPYNKGEAPDTSLFINRVCRIVEGELQSWSALVGGSRKEADNPGATGATPEPDAAHKRS